MEWFMQALLVCIWDFDCPQAERQPWELGSPMFRDFCPG